MIDSAIVAGYRRAIARRGEQVTFERRTGQATGAKTSVQTVSAVVQAIVMNYQVEPSVMPVEPEGSVTLGDKMIIALEADLLLQEFPLPLRKNDKVLVKGDWLNIETLDPSKRGLAGAVEIHAKGSK